ncbi:MAG: hypothetical protein M1816_006929 [Peltula sp. TS41687]|nr:MAG: hypothetical protein M1816_006929 [Peltula sp. TS41687]
MEQENPSSSSMTTTKKRKRESKPVEVLEVDISAPEPASKKAMRKAKKPKKSGTVSSKDVHHDTATSSRISKAIQSTESEKQQQEKLARRSEHGIWIGNLSFKTTKADLRSFLTSSNNNASITDDEITRIHLPTVRGPGASTTTADAKAKGAPLQNKGFAYIDLATAEALRRALNLSETLLTGRRVLIKDAKSFEGRPDKAKAETTSSSNSSSRRIFVGNLGFDVTTADLQEHFAQCGEVRDVHTATFEDSGKCKGYAWVEFDRAEAAKVAVRGWVRTGDDGKEGESSDDEVDEEEGDGEGAEGSGAKKPKKRRRKDRRWVNRIQGRQLRMEFAEDKSVRYQKRFGSGRHQTTPPMPQKEVEQPAITPAGGGAGGAVVGVGVTTMSKGTKIKFD